MKGSVEFALLILLVIILAGPILAERMRIPGLIGLIFFGMLVGPFVLGWVGRVGLVAALGDIGLLYLMFLAGLSFNIRAFMENKANALVYGLLGFVVPFVMSYYYALSFVGLGILGAALVGAMWASNTLVAYPDVQAAGLQNNRAVSAAVSAGVVADLLSLTVLAVVTSTAVIEVQAFANVEATTPDPTLPIWVGAPLLVAFSFWGLPKLAEWFFVKIGHSRSQRFVFALAGMAAAASLALLGGLEGLIGAFLAGLGLNALIPARSALMDRLDFVGGAFFIPAFLVSIGLAIDPRALVQLDTIVLALAFTGLVVVGKSLAAGITGGIFKLSFNEIALMASLSTGQAASTLAIAQIGVSLDLFGQDVVNAAILTVVVTAFITSYGTRFFSQKVERPPLVEKPLGDGVLVDVRPLGSDLSRLMEIAGAIARADRGVVVPYMVPATGQLDVARKRVQQSSAAAAQAGHDVTPELRVDDNFAAGTLSLAEETDASCMLLSWRGPRVSTDMLFGNEVDLVGERSPIPTAAVRVLRPWNRIIVLTGESKTDWNEEDSLLALVIARRIQGGKSMPMLIIANDPDELPERVAGWDNVEVRKAPAVRTELVNIIGHEDLVVLPVHAIGVGRLRTPWKMAHQYRDTSVITVAGPHRLSVSGTSVQRNVHGIVNRADDASTPA